MDDVALPLLAADLSERDPFVLVLDDVHLITSRRSRSILGFLADEVPSCSQLVLVTRGDPGMRRGRLRVGGDLIEVGPRLLALDTEETRAIAALGGLALSEEEAEGLCASGRRGGLQSRACSNSRPATTTTQPPAPPAWPARSPRSRTTSSTRPVPGAPAGNLRTFLLGTSILRRMTPALCDAVLGTDHAPIRLSLSRARTRSSSRSTIAVSGTATTTSSAILSELERRHPELLPISLKRAADWCEHEAPTRRSPTRTSAAILNKPKDCAQALGRAHRQRADRDAAARAQRLQRHDRIRLSIAAAWVAARRRSGPARRCIAADSGSHST